MTLAGGYTDVETPSSIPNLEAKRIMADNTLPYWDGNVGRCRLVTSFYAFTASLVFLIVFKLLALLLFYTLLFYLLFFCLFAGELFEWLEKPFSKCFK